MIFCRNLFSLQDIHCRLQTWESLFAPYPLSFSHRSSTTGEFETDSKIRRAESGKTDPGSSGLESSLYLKTFQYVNTYR